MVGLQKTGLTTSFESGHEIELVVQPADVLGKHRKLSRESNPATIGKSVMEHWNSKIRQDAIAQGVEDKRICISLKSRDNDRFAYLEESLEEYPPDEIEWAWTNSERKGLQGRRKADGRLKSR